MTSSGSFGGEVVLSFDRRNALLDFNPLFMDFFQDRDSVFGTFPNQTRTEETENGNRYHFSIFEFWEAFMGRLTPNDVEEFLKDKLTDGEYSRRFIELIRDFEKTYKVAAVIIDKTKNDTAYLCPINFQKKELLELIGRYIPERDRPKPCRRHIEFDNYFGRVVGMRKKLFTPVYAKKEHRCKPVKNLRTLRLDLIEKPPQVVLTLPQAGSVRKLDYDSLLESLSSIPNRTTKHLTIEQQTVIKRDSPPRKEDVRGIPPYSLFHLKL